MTTLRLIKSIGGSPSRLALLLLPLVFACFAFLQETQAAPLKSPATPKGPAIPATPEKVPSTPAAPEMALANFNTADGNHALFSVTTGSANTAVGWYALFANTTNSFNTGLGAGALALNTADDNTAVGAVALFLNTTGTLNTAVGAAALVNNTTGSDNNAVGAFALNANNGDFNNAHGRIALTSNTTGIENEAFGDRALRDNVSGSHNTAMGDDALLVSTNDSNTAMGEQAGNGIIDGTNDVALGAQAGDGIVHASDVIAINVPGVSSVFGDASNTCYIGSIYNEPIGGAGTPHAMFVDADGVLGFNPSSRRVKHDIQPMDKASETLYALKPVTFKYNSDKKGMTQFGLIAEEVAEANPDLVLHDKDGNAESLRYEQIDAMLLNEFLKEHKKVEAQQATIAELKSTVAQQHKGMEGLTAQLKEQAAQIQKVSAQLEASKPTPQVVNNP